MPTINAYTSKVKTAYITDTIAGILSKNNKVLSELSLEFFFIRFNASKANFPKKCKLGSYAVPNKLKMLWVVEGTSYFIKDYRSSYF